MHNRGVRWWCTPQWNGAYAVILNYKRRKLLRFVPIPFSFFCRLVLWSSSQHWDGGGGGGFEPRYWQVSPLLKTGVVWYPSPVWNLRAVIWFPIPVSSLVLLSIILLLFLSCSISANGPFSSLFFSLLFLSLQKLHPYFSLREALCMALVEQLGDDQW